MILITSDSDGQQHDQHDGGGNGEDRAGRRPPPQAQLRRVRDGGEVFGRLDAAERPTEFAFEVEIGGLIFFGWRHRATSFFNLCIFSRSMVSERCRWLFTVETGMA